MNFGSIRLMHRIAEFQENNFWMNIMILRFIDLNYRVRTEATSEKIKQIVLLDRKEHEDDIGRTDF